MQRRELQKLTEAASLADSVGLECHAGHGLCFETVGGIARIPQIKELNIGHFLIGEAIFLGVDGAVRKMRKVIRDAINRKMDKVEPSDK